MSYMSRKSSVFMGGVLVALASLCGAAPPALVVEVCADCHALDGNSADPRYPRLAGMEQEYLVRQMKAFSSNKRRDESMSAIVSALDNNQFAGVAAYFSRQAPVAARGGALAGAAGAQRGLRQPGVVADGRDEAEPGGLVRLALLRAEPGARVDGPDFDRAGAEHVGAPLLRDLVDHLGAQVALEEPELEVEALGVHQAVRAAQPQRQLPALAGGEQHADLARQPARQLSFLFVDRKPFMRHNRFGASENIADVF